MVIKHFPWGCLGFIVIDIHLWSQLWHLQHKYINVVISEALDLCMPSVFFMFFVFFSVHCKVYPFLWTSVGGRHLLILVGKLIFFVY